MPKMQKNNAKTTRGGFSFFEEGGAGGSIIDGKFIKIIERMIRHVTTCEKQITVVDAY